MMDIYIIKRETIYIRCAIHSNNRVGSFGDIFHNILRNTFYFFTIVEFHDTFSSVRFNSAINFSCKNSNVFYRYFYRTNWIMSASTHTNTRFWLYIVDMWNYSYKKDSSAVCAIGINCHGSRKTYICLCQCSSGEYHYVIESHLHDWI